ncbi:hemerythrin domain-containing protein [Neobacillus sp. SM06]|uniref:hemerythrin domain-containing protein n=1 Tax=Neobacillus sp. SM06 TaxID=3422492 RepID=UPI003D2C78D5
MSGPSLRKKKAHHSIHDGIYTEARDLTNLLKKVISENQFEHLNELTEALIEHWETRTLAHAVAEEEGFFVEKLAAEPELEEMIIKLKRDHQLMKMIIEQIKQSIASEGVTENAIRGFDALLVLFLLHNEEEEKSLFIDA